MDNQKIAPGHFILKLQSPLISRKARPGQFVQILCADTADPLLPRPFSFLTANLKEFSVLYQVAGRGTDLLSHKEKGDRLWVVGPLGNGFGLVGSSGFGVRSKKNFLVGGGVGIPPLYHLAQELLKNKAKKENIHIFLGARNKTLLLCEKEFKKLGVTLHLATDDGSKGKKSYITELLDNFLNTSRPAPARQRSSGGTRDLLQKSGGSVLRRTRLIYACGPTSMLKAVSKVAHEHGVPCEVSVEVPMACGFGACLGCAVRVRSKIVLSPNPEHPTCLPDRQAPNCRFAIACTEGPVFNSEDVVW